MNMTMTMELMMGQVGKRLIAVLNLPKIDALFGGKEGYMVAVTVDTTMCFFDPEDSEQRAFPTKAAGLAVRGCARAPPQASYFYG